MTDQTDRIRQMAQEAGIQPPWDYDGKSQDTPWMADTDALAKFATLVAEDCARVCERMAARHNDIRSAALESAAENIRARCAIAKPPEAG